MKTVTQIVAGFALGVVVAVKMVASGLSDMRMPGESFGEALDRRWVEAKGGTAGLRREPAAK